MMNNDDRVALAVLQMLAEVDARLQAFRSQLMDRLAPAAVNVEVECKKYQETLPYPQSYDLTLDAYVDAEWSDGRAVTWYLLITHDGQAWHIEPSVKWRDQSDVVSLEERIVPHVQELLAEIPATLNLLFSSIEVVAKSIRSEPATVGPSR